MTRMGRTVWPPLRRRDCGPCASSSCSQGWAREVCLQQQREVQAARWQWRRWRGSSSGPTTEGGVGALWGTRKGGGPAWRGARAMGLQGACRFFVGRENCRFEGREKLSVFVEGPLTEPITRVPPSTVIQCARTCPSGLRGSTQARMASAAQVRTLLCVHARRLG